MSAPQSFEDHQEPHNYFNYTRYGLTLGLNESGFQGVKPEDVKYLSKYFSVIAQWLKNFWFHFGDGYIVKFLDLATFPIYFLIALVLVPLDRFDKSPKLTVNMACVATKVAK